MTCCGMSGSMLTTDTIQVPMTAAFRPAPGTQWNTSFMSQTVLNLQKDGQHLTTSTSRVSMDAASPPCTRHAVQNATSRLHTVQESEGGTATHHQHVPRVHERRVATLHPARGGEQ